MDVVGIQRRLQEFSAQRDWESFHNPKNLAMALAAECGELLEVFQWLTSTEAASPTQDVRARAAEELADVQIYLLRLAYKLDINLEQAVESKIEANAVRYPADQVRGSAAKRFGLSETTTS